MALAALFALLASIHVASAQDEREAARAEFRAGTEAFEADDFAAALEHYERAFALGPHDAVRFNIAVCLERLGRFRRAAEEYRLAAESPELDAASRARAAEALETVRARLGTLVVEGATADVELDGAPLCVAPCTVEIDPGPHALRAHAEGIDVDATIDLLRGERRVLVLSASEAAEPATLAVSVGPSPNPADPRVPGLAITGSVLTALGAAGAIALGVRTADLSAQYDAMPSGALRDEGLATEGGFHGALGLAALGGVLFVLELALAP